MENNELRATHTPGTWHVDRRSAYSPICVKPYPGRVICDIDGTDDEAEANSRLIAAAPDLLDACTVALSQLTEEREEYRDDDVAQLRKAIARAGYPRRRYRVLVRSSELLEAFVFAHSRAEAEVKVEEMDNFGDIAEQVRDAGEWFVESVEEAEEA